MGDPEVVRHRERLTANVAGNFPIGFPDGESGVGHWGAGKGERAASERGEREGARRYKRDRTQKENNTNEPSSTLEGQGSDR